MKRLRNIILPPDTTAAYDIQLSAGQVDAISPTTARADDPPSLLLPPLCHPHVHLDKAYLLTSNDPAYHDLLPSTGQFSEALTLTSQAKKRYTSQDLYRRGEQLLATSYTQGVTSMRAFVEVDHVTRHQPLSVALELKAKFDHLVDVQICAFAQDPLFSSPHAHANRSAMEDALRDLGHSIGVVGTTPYVEDSRDAALANIEWAITTAVRNRCHLDIHLDYNLDPDSRPMAFHVLDLLEKHRWREVADKSRTIVLGHCTKLTAIRDAELKRLADAILASELPIHFVGLPTSDLYMMGRPGAEATCNQHRPRGTINVPSLIKEHSLSACLGANNVGNAFTPYGSGDPLQLASWAVGIFQAGAVDDADLLYECVSTRAMRAIGLDPRQTRDVFRDKGNLSGMLLLKPNKPMELPGAPFRPNFKVDAKPRRSIRDVVWDPPEVDLRWVVR